ncbi:putative ABC transporter-associated repeat protein [Diaminobutyricimonas aerilata]|uniref:Putative ABC transporter-associated repeat protein n=1 Tax=Diaminobutyricimonas aerilata TaxID=1162967 RepID=A0A2M9CMA1_9MICO|nr:choice-of-anchor M domain-containing protein [Diaminobutyricimonas aerilata]PJJ72998.1 putative ABC transporter-associated repeat protein [Diaminobutyricimonas aerilata]
MTRTRFLTRALPAAALLLAAASLLAPTAASATGTDLDQTLDENMAVVGGERVLDVGHVDMGPKFVDGEWRFLIHDDVAKADANATSVWRYPDETVLHVNDASQLTVPDDPAYAFLGAEPGSPVWVVPQTQNPDVVWLGWNTQDPEVMQSIDRGITLSLTGAEGPGTVTVYLQSGSFGEPQVLWDSRVTEPQAAWVDVNTHTHANWVFTQPGVYLLELTAEADLVDGSTVSDTQVVRFAVGSSTPPVDAFAATWGGTGAAAAADADPRAATEPAAVPAEAGSDPLVPILLGAIAVVALALVAGIVVAVVRGNRAKRAVLADRGEESAG